MYLVNFHSNGMMIFCFNPYLGDASSRVFSHFLSVWFAL